MRIRFITVLLLALVVVPSTLLAGEKRLDISPAVLMNLSEGHGGSFMGGAVSADLYLTKALAIRSTLGYTKDRVFPSNRPYGEANYRTWASFAPYVEANIGNRIRPYLALQGSITASTSNHNLRRAPIGFEQAPVANLQNEYRANSYFSTAVTLGTKLQLTRPLALFAEVSHFFYSTVSDDDVFVAPVSGMGGGGFDFERNPTYASFGLSYSFTIGSDNK